MRDFSKLFMESYVTFGKILTERFLIGEVGLCCEKPVVNNSSDEEMRLCLDLRGFLSTGRESLKSPESMRV